MDSPEKLPPNLQVLRERKEERQAVFIKTYRDTGSMIKAAEAAKVNKFNHYRWMRDPKYAEQYAMARKTLGAKLEAAVYDRAVNGTEEPVYFNGERVGERVVFDPRREQMVLKALLPDEYATRVEIDIKTIPRANLLEELAKLEGEAQVMDAEFEIAEDPHPIETPPDPGEVVPPPPETFPPM